MPSSASSGMKRSSSAVSTSMCSCVFICMTGVFDCLNDCTDTARNAGQLRALRPHAVIHAVRDKTHHQEDLSVRANLEVQFLRISHADVVVFRPEGLANDRLIRGLEPNDV